MDMWGMRARGYELWIFLDSFRNYWRRKFQPWTVLLKYVGAHKKVSIITLNLSNYDGADMTSFSFSVEMSSCVRARGIITQNRLSSIGEGRGILDDAKETVLA
jgi:hypothetical protein